MWAYRSANGLQPFDPFLAVTSTLTGSAESWWAQRKNGLNRSIKHIVGNSWRTDGFISNSESADRALKSLGIMGAKYIVGYPSGIASLARRAEERGLSFPYLSHAILTSETIEDADIELIERAFQVTVLVEYGAIELGAVAGSQEKTCGWPLKVHWWSYFIHLDEDSSALISTLTPRGFPLVNYAVGDLIDPGLVTPSGSVLSIEQVLERTRDMVSIETRGGQLKSVLARSLHNLVRDLPKVSSVQVVQRQQGRIDLLIVAVGADQAELTRRISASFRRNRKEYKPGSVSVSFIDQHITTARGKRGVVVDRKDVPEPLPAVSVIVE